METFNKYTIQDIYGDKTVFVISNDYQGETYYKCNPKLPVSHLGHKVYYNSIESFFKVLRKTEKTLNTKATYAEPTSL